ncbi:MAG: MCE family protein [Spartobacteria bacterium]|nr:MCE family protein [Spartobacteria bacterium]
MKFKKQVAIEATVGIFAFLIIAVLFALTTYLSEEMLFREYEYLDVVFESVSGLRVGDEVSARGVTIGKVKGLWLESDGVHLRARLDVPVELHEGYRIEVATGSVLGGRFLRVDLGDPAAPGVPLDPEAPLAGCVSAELMDTATKTVQDIQAALNDGVLADLKAAMAQIRKIAESLGEGNGTLSRLLNDEQLYGDVQQIAANARTISDALAKGEGTIGKLVMDDEVYGQLRQIAANLGDVSARLAQGEGTMGRLLSEDDQVYRDLAAAIAEVRTIAESVGRGEGTLGKLLADDGVYREFEALLREGRATVDDMRETSPVTTFTSIFFGAF